MAKRKGDGSRSPPQSPSFTGCDDNADYELHCQILWRHGCAASILTMLSLVVEGGDVGF